MTLILNREQVASVLEMADCMEVVEKAFLELAKGTANLPLRNNIMSPDGLSLYMPAYLQESEALACKVVTVYKNNPANYNLPVVLGKVLLQDPKTGDVLCIMDGGYLTAVRTGAASGVATKYMARKDEGQVAGIFGTGAQAQMQLWAVDEARELSRALVYDINKEAAVKFAKELSEEMELEIMVVDEPNKVLEADIICAATSSPTPIFDGSNVHPGTHINGIGSHTPNARELDAEIIKRSYFIGDSREACFSEAGDIIIPVNDGIVDEDHYKGDLGAVVAGDVSGREDNDQITIFKSNGLAIQDTATAKLVYDKAREAGIGTEVTI